MEFDEWSRSKGLRPETVAYEAMRMAFEAGVEHARAWTPTAVRKPEGGQLIVRRWKHGAVWAGTHDEGSKNETFHEWKAL
jgi:hypothetical protein